MKMRFGVPGITLCLSAAVPARARAKGDTYAEKNVREVMARQEPCLRRPLVGRQRDARRRAS